MIEYKRGNLFTEDAEAMVNTVNCVGVMGRGIALQFKKAFPENFKAYAMACKREAVKPGHLFVYETGKLANPRYIINFPTKRHWREKSRMEDIEAGLGDLVRILQEKRIRSIVLPPLGAGLGGLDWSEVRRRIEQRLGRLAGIRVIVFEPKGIPERTPDHHSVPKMTRGRAALVELVNHYLWGLLDPFISLLELHKLMYFMQEAGEPLRLRYKKAIYGPYAENLRHVLHAIEGHMIVGYADGGDAPKKPLHLMPGALEAASRFLDTHPEARVHCDRVVKLIKGFESPFGLELLSTVHWVMKYEAPHSREDLVQKIYAWNKRKQQFTPRQINLARDVLLKQGWAEPFEK